MRAVPRASSRLICKTQGDKATQSNKGVCAGPRGGFFSKKRRGYCCQLSLGFFSVTISPRGRFVYETQLRLTKLYR